MAVEIDDRWEDYDFPSDERFVPGDLGVRLFAGAQEYEKSEPILSMAEIREAAEQQEAEGSLEWLVKRVFNQGREGSCVGNAGTADNMIIQAIQFGLENVVDLSPSSLYQLIGRSPSSGAMVSDCMEAQRDIGIIPLDTPENRARFGNIVMPATGFYERRPAGWESIAAQFRAPEHDTIRTFEGMLSALARRKPVQVGREGHSILYLGIRWVNGRFKFPILNSWGMNWGQAMGTLPGGFGFDTETQAKKSARWAYTARTVRRAA